MSWLVAATERVGALAVPQRGELRVLGRALLLVGLAAAQHLLVVLLLVVDGQAAAADRPRCSWRRVSANDHGLDRNRFFSSIATMPPGLVPPVEPGALGEDPVEQRELSTSSRVRGEGERLELALLEALTSRRSALRRRTAMSRSARSSRLAPRLNRRPSIISISAVNDSE